MVTFWVDEELEGGVEVTVRFANGADVIRRVIARSFGCPVAHHGRDDYLIGRGETRDCTRWG